MTGKDLGLNIPSVMYCTCDGEQATKIYLLPYFSYGTNSTDIIDFSENGIKLEWCMEPVKLTFNV